MTTTTTDRVVPDSGFSALRDDRVGSWRIAMTYQAYEAWRASSAYTEANRELADRRFRTQAEAAEGAAELAGLVAAPDGLLPDEWGGFVWADGRTETEAEKEFRFGYRDGYRAAQSGDADREDLSAGTDRYSDGYRAGVSAYRAGRRDAIEIGDPRFGRPRSEWAVIEAYTDRSIYPI